MKWMLTLCLTTLLFANEPMQKANAMRLIVNEAEQIIIPQALKEVLKQVNLEPKDDKIETLIEGVHRTWLRKPGQERWHLPYMSIEDRPALMQNFQKLGMIDEIRPTQNQYDYALVLGCAIPCIKQRLAHLARLWNEGVRFRQIVFLTSDRPLDADYETQESLLDDIPSSLPMSPLCESEALPTTEAEAMMFYYRHALLPPEFKALALQVVVAKTSDVISSVKLRPNRGDTALAWFKYKPKPGHVLAISSQPHVGYEFAVLRHVLPPSFALDVVGNKTTVENNPAIFLDTLARWMFVEVCEFD